MRQRSTFLISCLCFGFAFFYIPIISMIVYSFNKSRLATVWGGSRLKVLQAFKNAQIIKAATLSCRLLFSAQPLQQSSLPWPVGARTVFQVRGARFFRG